MRLHLLAVTPVSGSVSKWVIDSFGYPIYRACELVFLLLHIYRFEMHKMIDEQLETNNSA